MDKPKAKAIYVYKADGYWHYEFYLNNKRYSGEPTKWFTETDAYKGLRSHVKRLGGVIDWSDR